MQHEAPGLVSTVGKPQPESPPPPPEMLTIPCAECGARWSISRVQLGSKVYVIRCTECGAPVQMKANRAVPRVEGPREQTVELLRSLLATPSGDAWVFAPPCAAAAIADFERAHGIELPRDYARFLSEVGNGTLEGGPLALCPLGMLDDGAALVAFEPSVPDALRQPFSNGPATMGGDHPTEEPSVYRPSLQNGHCRRGRVLGALPSLLPQGARDRPRARATGARALQDRARRRGRAVWQAQDRAAA